MHLAYFHYLCEGCTGLNHVRQFADAARRLGHRVDVHAMNLEVSGLSGSEDEGLRLRLRRALKKRAGRYLHEPKELLWNARYLRREFEVLRSVRPDVLLVRDAILSASSVVVARRLGIPLVVESNAPCEESRLFFDEYAHLPFVPEWIQGWKMRRADAVVTVSSTLKRRFVELYGLSEEKLTVAMNGADVGVFRPDAPCDSKLAWRLERGPVVGFVGSFQKFHGSELLGRLAIEVGKARPDVRFLFVGDGAGAPAVRRATAALGDRAFFTGMVPHDRVPGLVASFDIGVMPETAFYCSPLKILEWMAAGKAVVAPRYEPLEACIEDGVHGLLFPPRDVAALVEAVIRLVDDTELRRNLGRAAAEQVRSSCTWAHNAQHVISACTYALEHHV